MNTTGIITETSRGLQITGIEDEFLRKRTIFFCQPFNADSCNELLQKLIYLETDNHTKEVTILINSPGGDAKSGLAVYDFIRMMRSPVRTVCTGLAASMASLIFLAGDKREMLPHTEIMMHDPYYGSGTIKGAKIDQLQKMLDDIKELRDDIARIISERTGIELSEVYKITAKDSFFKAKEALNLGIATNIISEWTSAEE